MICTICGKIVRDMRKHKLVHSGEKPFQCDRCSYRCSRSGTLRRHMATHLNSNDPTRTNLEAMDPNQQTPAQDQHHPEQQQQQPQQEQQQQPPPPAQHTMQTIQIDQTHAIPIHIQEPKYIELNPSTLAEHLPPQYATPQPSTTTLQTVTYREFKFP